MTGAGFSVETDDWSRGPAGIYAAKIPESASTGREDEEKNRRDGRRLTRSANAARPQRQKLGAADWDRKHRRPFYPKDKNLYRMSSVGRELASVQPAN